MSIFEQFTKGQMDAQEMLNRNFAAVEAQLANKANVGTLEWHDLALTEGLKKYSTCQYCRTQEQIGIIQIAAETEEGADAIAAGTRIAVLPEGFRPHGRVPLPATFESRTSLVRAAGVLILHPNGDIVLGAAADTAVYAIYCSNVFNVPGK